MKNRISKSGRIIRADGFVESRRNSEKKQSSIINAVGVGLFGFIYVGTTLLTSTVAVLAAQALKLIPTINSIPTAVEVARTNLAADLGIVGAAIVGIAIARWATKSIID